MENNNKVNEILKSEKEIISNIQDEKKLIKNRSDKGSYFLSGAILFSSFLIAGAIIYSNGVKVTPTANVLDSGTKAADANKNVLQVKNDDIVLGQSNAPVTIVLYSDPSCPFCAAADGADIIAGQDNTGKDIHIISGYLQKSDPTWSAPVPGIIANYVNSGKVRLVFRYFPGHGAGEQAMKVLYCANEQGKFWPLMDEIFKNQSVVSDLNKVEALASGVGADVSKINDCLSSKKYDYKIKQDTDSGTQAGVNGTPGFFINGTLLSGAQPFSQFQKAIDAALQAK
ncbi:MAG: DsbA family protein [Patescibacteria group bacterium]|nr:DsbA family protein [Patescibacteria group bacterium]